MGSLLIEEGPACVTSPRRSAPAKREPVTTRPSQSVVRRQEQFQALSVPLADALYSTALRWQRDPVRAEDLVQETYLRAWERFDRFTLGTNFKAWIFQVLRYVHSNLRRSSRRREVTVDFMSNEDAFPANGKSRRGASSAADINWDSHYGDVVDDTFKRALEQLDPGQRAVLFRVPLGQRSYQECADELGIPLGTVMSRLSRARTRLREQLHAHARREGMDVSACAWSGR